MNSDSSPAGSNTSGAPTFKRIVLVMLVLAAFAALLPRPDGPGILLPSSPQIVQQATAIPPTANPYADLEIDSLTARSYGDGDLRVVERMGTGDRFTRYLVAYPSDGLTIYGFMNVPDVPGPLPVIVAVHGYVTPSIYNTLDYTTRYADALASAGFLVLHPNLRGYRPSDSGPNPFRVGMAIDVLNLIALVRRQGGQPGPLESANPAAIGLWGHSMGGGISIRAMVVDPGVRGVVLYGSMSGDEQRNYERILMWTDGAGGRAELALPQDVLARLSPINYLNRVQASVSIHHGGADDTVPPEWSSDLCARLQAAARTVECFTYEGQPHTFQGAGDILFLERIVAFYDRVLRIG